jgi:hypothetical protein
MELAEAYATKYPEMLVYLEDLKSIITQYISSEIFEGNCFYYHDSLNEYPELYTKQLNLFWCGKQPATRMCEIGFNAGHSSMLLLLGRNCEPMDFTVFDIGHHQYTAPCFDYIKQSFSHVKSNDMKNADILLKMGGIMVIDDTNAEQINNQVNLYLASGRYVELCVFKTFGYSHRMIRKV